MVTNLIRRLVYSIVTVLSVTVLAFVIQFVVPSDPARSIAGPRATAKVLAQVRENLHLDDPLIVQLGRYLWNLLSGDFGTSYVTGRPVLDLILERLPATALLAAAAMAVEVVLGLAWGFWEALRPRRSAFLAVANVTLLSIPTYALAFLLLLVGGYQFGIFPISGGVGASKLVLPALTLGLIGAPYYANVMRDSVRAVVSGPYIRTAVAKGVPRQQILRRHVFRNAIPPAVTMMGMDVAVFLSGVVFVEQIFAWPGIGQLQVTAFKNVDRPLLTGTVIVGAVLVVGANLVVDAVRGFIDPKARSQV